MNNRANTIAGWVLGCGIVALDLTIVTGEYFKDEDIREEDSESFIQSNFSSFNEQQQGPNPK